MTVYIEYVFVCNFVFDFILLFFSCKISGAKVSGFRLIWADVVATTVAVVLPLFNLVGFSGIFAKLLLSLVVVFALVGCKSKKQFLANLLIFWGLTFGMGGILVGIYFITAQDFALTGDLSVVSSSPVPLYLGGVFVFWFLVKNLVGFIFAKNKNAQFIYEVAIFVDDKRFDAKGFLDSGNQLCDSKSGLPVVIVTSKKLKKFLSDKLADDFVSSSNALSQVHYIKYATLANSNQKMLIFKVKKVVVNGLEKDVFIGLSQKNFSFDNCDLLLNAKMSL